MEFNPDVLELLGTLTDEEKETIAEQFIESLPEKAFDHVIKILDEKDFETLIEPCKTFDLEGFRAFFSYCHRIPLHREGERWARKVFEAIRTKRRKLLQKAFRGSGKTTVFSKFFQLFFLGHFPHTTNCVIRVNGAKANETVSQIINFINEDERWKRIFPHVVPDKALGWGEKSGYYLQRTDMARQDWLDLQADSGRPSGATIIGYGYDSGSVQGFRPNGVLLVDDIHNKENTKTDNQLNDVKSFVRLVLKPMIVPNETLEIWNYTPWLVNDAYAEREATGLYIQSSSPVMWPANEGDEGAVYWPKKLGVEFLDNRVCPFAKQWWVLSWPERWGFVELATMYIDIGHIAFAREYLLDLEAMKGQKLRADWLHQYDILQIKPEWPVIFGIDYASVSDKLKQKDRDYFALAIYRAIPGGGLVLIDGVRAHLMKAEALEMIGSVAQAYPTLKKVGVEAIGKGEEFYNDLLFTVDFLGKPLPLRAIISHRSSKGDRIENWLAPKFQATRIWISSVKTTFLNDFENEWLMYPNAEHDDCLDAAYMGAHVAEVYLPNRKPGKSAKKKKKNNPFSGGYRTSTRK